MLHMLDYLTASVEMCLENELFLIIFINKKLQQW